MPRSTNNLVLGIVLLAFGALVLALIDKGVPDRSQLTQVTGQIRSLDTTTSKGGGLSAVRLSLASDPRDFQYLSKAGDVDAVWSALRQAGRAEIGLWVDPAKSHSPLFESRDLYVVYEIRVGANTIRSHAQVTESWGTDNFTGVLLGYGSGSIGIAMLLVHVLQRGRRA